ncbi:iron chaperone [Microbacterium sp. SORGH_AS_0888]|uniref:iron chaperone n=1 Tax=Microbacterium sp. SORGH_AS_0888 TaxID=3041791 RepID=UPI002784AD8C|nr:hypothetical protein [Microbacterium sp. SORGH_AS_0888]MDQ1130577.1 uncharacterized protein YdhG (YjbR/CyaY superfamily) [Microbacterium sp. SORGH_AS_0888]
MATKKGTGAFSAEERAAMKEAASEARAQKARAGKADKAAADLADVLEKIAAMAPTDRELAEKVHETVLAAAPGLAPRTWYGMPAYAKDGKVLAFFQDAGTFTARYATLGFQDVAQLDDGAFWPTSYALVAWDDQVARTITDLVRRAVG